MFNLGRLESERDDDDRYDDEEARAGGKGMGEVGGINTSYTFLPKPRQFRLRFALRRSPRVHLFPRTDQVMSNFGIAIPSHTVS